MQMVKFAKLWTPASAMLLMEFLTQMVKRSNLCPMGAEVGKIDYSTGIMHSIVNEWYDSIVIAWIKQCTVLDFPVAKVEHLLKTLV